MWLEVISLKEYIKILSDHNVDLEGLQIVEGGKTFKWSGKYHYDLNVRDTLFTELNVFEKFDPVIPESFRKSKYICLGNIDPVLQAKSFGSDGRSAIYSLRYNELLD